MKKKSFFLVATTVLFLLSFVPVSFGWTYVETDWSEEYPTCGGTSQSPIDISTADVVQAETPINMDFVYKRGSAINTGYTIKVATPSGKYIKIEGEKFTLVQFHFHSLSEHTVNGQYYPMEMHLVHANDAYLAGEAGGELAVIGIFIKVGQNNELLSELFENLPTAATDSNKPPEVDALIANYYKLLPENKDMYTYDGSLTTPGCNEIVKWHVLVEPIEMSAAQITVYRDLYDIDAGGVHSNRPIQSLNGRIVTLSSLDGNVSPELIGTGTESSRYSVLTGENLKLNFFPSDINNDSVTVSAPTLPAFASQITGADNITLSFTPGLGDVGVHDVTVTASDGSNSTSVDFTVEVLEPEVRGRQVPTTTEWGMILLGGLLMVAAYRKKQEISASN